MASYYSVLMAAGVCYSKSAIHSEYGCNVIFADDMPLQSQGSKVYSCCYSLTAVPLYVAIVRDMLKLFRKTGSAECVEDVEVENPLFRDASAPIGDDDDGDADGANVISKEYFILQSLIATNVINFHADMLPIIQILDEMKAESTGKCQLLSRKVCLMTIFTH